MMSAQAPASLYSPTLPPGETQPVSSPGFPETTANANSTGATSSTVAGSSEPGSTAPAPPTSASAAAKASRRRTKTGCLTCRKRRIKCGEERPICANCVKSKRTCEGYNQRVVFKDGMNSLRSMAGMPHLNPSPVDRRYHPYPIQPAPPSHHILQPIAPAPPPQAPPPQIYLRENHQIIPLDQTRAPHLRAFNVDHQRLAQQTQFQSPHSPLEHHRHQQQHHHGPSGYSNGYYSSAPSLEATYSAPTSATTEVPPPYPSPVYGGPVPQQQVYKSSQSLGGASAHSSTSPGDCSFNPPLDSKYVMSMSSGQVKQHPAEEFGGIYSGNQNIIRRFTCSPADEVVYYTE